MTTNGSSFLGCLALGLLAGIVMQRSDFCLAGMFRDRFAFGARHMLRSLLLLIAASMLLFEGARQLGILPAYPAFLMGPPNLAAVLGGFLFGMGMVLAGGCVVGTLYKMGSGRMLSLVAFSGLIAGSAFYAEVHPQWIRVAAQLALPTDTVTVPQLLGVPPAWLVLPLLLLLGLLFAHWYRNKMWRRLAYADGYLQPWLAALILALIGAASYTLVGMPLGITTFYAKLASWFGQVLWPVHVATLPFFQATPLQASVRGTELVGGPGPAMDAIAWIQGPLILGITLGALLSCLSLRELRVRWRVPAREYAIAVVGGFLLAVGSRIGAGCNVWHLLGGIPLLSLQSLLFTLGLIPGSYVGTKTLVPLIAGSPVRPRQPPGHDVSTLHAQP